MSAQKKLTQLTITADFDGLICDIMENQPEHSAGMCVQCYSFDYKTTTFLFRDVEADHESPEKSIIPMKVVKRLELRFGVYENQVLYVVTLPRLRVGFKILMDQVFAGKLPGLHLSVGNFMDAGHWDSECGDALVQCAIFGDVIYG